MGIPPRSAPQTSEGTRRFDVSARADDEGTPITQNTPGQPSMKLSFELLSRRSFLTSSAAGLLASAGVAQQPRAEPVSFFVIGDTHYLADKANPDKLDARS